MLLQTYTIYLERLREPRSIVDIVFVFVIVYAVLKLLRGTRAVPMAAGLGAFALLYLIARLQQLATLEYFLSNALPYVGFVIIVLFQNELRQALTAFGSRIRMPLVFASGRDRLPTDAYDEVVLAATTLASTKTGALIVIERTVGLKNFIDAGVGLGAALSYDLLVTIFNPATPLHDGAVIVREHRIAAAACFLPLTLNPQLSKDLGTRHRAAIGITEDTDAVAVVVSEETGLISFVEGGRIRRGLDAVTLGQAITRALNSPVTPLERTRRTRRRPRTGGAANTHSDTNRSPTITAEEPLDLEVGRRQSETV